MEQQQQQRSLETDFQTFTDSESELGSSQEETLKPQSVLKLQEQQNVKTNLQQNKQQQIKIKDDDISQKSTDDDTKPEDLDAQLKEIQAMIQPSLFPKLELNEKLLLELNKIQQQYGSEILNKTVIVLYGITGAGKSSTINSVFQVATLIKTVDELDDENTNLVFLNEKAKVGKSGTKSQTLFPQAIQAPPNFCDNIGENLFFLDLPGTMDQRGPAVDISITIMISKILQQCKKIKPVIVFNVLEFNVGKMQSIKNTLKLFCSQIDIKQHSQDISIFITHAPKYEDQEEATHNLKKNFKQLLKCFTEEYEEHKRCEDKNVKDFLTQYLKNYKKNYPFIVYIDDEQNSENMKQYFNDNPSCIENPKESIKSGKLSQINFQYLKQYYSNITEKLRFLLENVNIENINLIKYCLFDAKQLSLDINNSILNKDFEISIKLVVKFMTNMLEKSQSIYNNLQKTDFGYNIKDQDIQNLKDIYQIVSVMDESQIALFLENKDLQNLSQKLDKQLQDTCEYISENIKIFILKDFNKENFQKACYQLFKLLVIGNWQKSTITYFEQSLGIIEAYIKKQHDQTIDLVNQILKVNKYESPNEITSFNTQLLELQKKMEYINELQLNLKNNLKPNFIEEQQSMYQKQPTSFQQQINKNYDCIQYYENIVKYFNANLNNTNQTFQNKIVKIQETFKQFLQGIDSQSRKEEQQLPQNQVLYNSEEEKNEEIRIDQIERISDSQSECTSYNQKKYEIPQKEYFILNKISKTNYFEQKFPQSKICQDNDGIIIQNIENFLKYLRKTLETTDKYELSKALGSLKHEFLGLKGMYNLVENKDGIEDMQKQYLKLEQKIENCVIEIGKSIRKTIEDINSVNENGQNQGKNIQFDSYFTQLYTLQKLIWIDDLFGKNKQNVQQTVQNAKETLEYFLSNLYENCKNDNFMQEIKVQGDVEIQKNIMLQIQNLINLHKNVMIKKQSKKQQQESQIKEKLLETIQSILSFYDQQLENKLKNLIQKINQNNINFKTLDIIIEVLYNYKLVTENFKSSEQSLGFKIQISEFFESLQNILNQQYILKYKQCIESIDLNQVPENNNFESTIFNQSQLNNSNNIQNEQSQIKKYIFGFGEIQKIFDKLQEIQIDCPNIIAHIFDKTDVANEMQQIIQRNFLDIIQENYYDTDRFENLQNQQQQYYQYQKYLYAIVYEFKKSFRDKGFNIPQLDNPQKEVNKKIEEIYNHIKNLSNFDLEKEILDESQLVVNLKHVKEIDFNNFKSCINKGLINFNYKVNNLVNNISKFRYWLKDIEKNIDNLNSIQPYIDFFQIFQYQDKIKDQLNLVSKEFDLQFLKMEKTIETQIMNLELYSAYKNYLILKEIIIMFNDKQTNASFLPSIDYFNSEDLLLKKVLQNKLEDLQISIQQSKNGNNYLKENNKDKVVTDLQLLFKEQLGNSLQNTLQNFQSVYMKKYIDNVLEDFKSKQSNCNITKLENMQKQTKNQLEELHNQINNRDDKQHLQEQIENIKESIDQLKDNQKTNMQIMQQNILTLGSEELKTKWQSLNSDQKRELQQELLIQYQQYLIFVENYNIEQSKYQNLDEFQNKMSNFEKIIQNIYIISGQEIQFNQQQQEKKSACQLIINKLQDIIKKVQQQIQNKDYTYGSDLEKFLTYVPEIFNEFNKQKNINDDQYKNFTKCSDQIQNKIGKQILEIYKLFKENLEKDNTYIQTKNQLIQLQKIEPLLNKLIEINKEKPQYISTKLKEVQLNSISLEDSLQQIIKKCKNNLNVIQKELQNYNIKKIKQCIINIQNTYIVEEFFQLSSLQIRNLINNKTLIQTVTDFQDKMYVKCEEMVKSGDFCKQLDTQLQQLKVVDDCISEFPDTFKNYNPCQKKINDQLVQFSKINTKEGKEVIKHPFSSEDPIYEIQEEQIRPILKIILKSYKIFNNIQLDVVKNKIRDDIEDMLNLVNTKLQGQLLNSFGQYLAKFDTQLGQEIVDTFNIFAGLQCKYFKDKTSSQNIDYSNDNFKELDTDKVTQQLDKSKLQSFSQETKDIILKQYQKQEQIFDLVLQCYFTQNVQNMVTDQDIKFQIQQLIQNIQALQNGKQVEIDLSDHIQVIGELLGKLFALWSILDNKKRNKSQDNHQNQSSLRQPHPVQVLSVIIMLNLHLKPKNEKQWYKEILKQGTFSSQVVEILTGQGKSITLGMTSLILALLGYNVQVACYSQYLSKRDYDDFYPIFDFMDIPQEKIFYGTYKSIIERYLNKYVNIRNLGEKYFQDKEEYLKIVNEVKLMKQSQKESQEKSILLIDEVDQFYSKNIYGQSYNPCQGMQFQEMQAIYEFIWKNRDISTLSNDVQNLPEYQQLLQNYPQLKNIIQDHITQKMCSQVKNLDNHYQTCQPQVVNGKIGYKKFDSISTSSTYGYYTNFAYFREHDQDSKKISKEMKLSQCTIQISFGNFSYAQLPFDMNFENIMGVTGTLLDLDPKVIEYFKDYQINKLYFAPSIFAGGPADFYETSGIQVYNDTLEWHSNLYATTLKAQKEGQPSIIFFEKESELIEYKTYLENESKYDINTYQILTQDYEDQYETIIKNATKKGVITLTIACFGRGVDFKCYDNQIDKLGGFFVIMAFISPEKVEDTQIRGRTARNGQKGLIEYHLLQKSLQDSYEINAQQIQEWKNDKQLYKNIDKTRTQIYSQSLQKQKNDVEGLKLKYIESQKLLSAFLDNNEKDIITQLEIFN